MPMYNTLPFHLSNDVKMLIATSFIYSLQPLSCLQALLKEGLIALLAPYVLRSCDFGPLTN